MYKVGDKVRIIRDTCFHKEKIGTIITIIHINHSTFLYSGGLNGSHDGSGNFVRSDDIEPVIRNPIEELFNHFKGLGKPEDIKIIKE